MRKLYLERCCNNNALSGRQRGGQNNLYDVEVLRMSLLPCSNAIYFEVKPVYVSSLFFSGEIEISTVIYQQLFIESSLIIPVSIRPDMKPDKAQGVW